MNKQHESDYNERAAKRAAERREKMLALRKQGWTFEAIGRRFGRISRQRVQAIVGSTG